MIRALRYEDLPAFYSVMTQCAVDPRSSWSRTTLDDVQRSFKMPGAGGFVALAAHKVVGSVGYRPDGPTTLTLNKLATLPEVRGQGIGQRLVKEVERYALIQGFSRVLLAVSQFNLGVIPFYERLGYVQSEPRYAFAHPASPLPVVLVKAIGRQKETL